MLKSIKRKYYFIANNLTWIFSYIFIDEKKLKIKKGEIVCDFGGGSHPLLRADIIVDKYLKGDAERPLDFLDIGAIIVQCDFNKKLPFKDKSIDFAFSSHVIEHISQPKNFLEEMSRGAKRGCIICPSGMREELMALRVHLWFIENKNGVLEMLNKEKPTPRYLGETMCDLMISPDNYVWYNFEKYFKNKFEIVYSWNDKIRYKFLDKEENSPAWKSSGETVFIPNSQSSFFIFALEVRKIILKMAAIIKRFFHSNKNFDIKNILCCPVCDGNFEYTAEKCTCLSCGKSFYHDHFRIFYLDT